MLREGESQLPQRPQDIWVNTWRQVYEIHQTPPEHVRARIALEKSIWNAGDSVSLESDTFFHSRLQIAKSNISAISKEWGLAEHINMTVRQVPEMFLRTAYGSELTRSEVVSMMNHENASREYDDQYQTLEEGVMQQVMRREAKVSRRKK